MNFYKHFLIFAELTEDMEELVIGGTFSILFFVYTYCIDICILDLIYPPQLHFNQNRASKYIPFLEEAYNF